MVPVVVCSVIYGMFMANCYKLYGLSMGMDDKSLTIIGSIGSAFNGCSRAFWAMLMDKIGYKKTYFFLIFINLFIYSILNNFVMNDRMKYAIAKRKIIISQFIYFLIKSYLVRKRSSCESLPANLMLKYERKTTI